MAQGDGERLRAEVRHVVVAAGVDPGGLAIRPGRPSHLVRVVVDRDGAADPDAAAAPHERKGAR